MEAIDYSCIEKVASMYGTPFYLMNSGIYEKNISDFTQTLKKYYDKIVVGYSFKTNYVPALCKSALQHGCYAEVVSAMEFDLAEKCGFKNIIFNGPVKSFEYVSKALNYGAVVNIDSEYELDYISYVRKHNPNMLIKVGIRVNVGLKDEKGNSTIQNGLRQGRFGFATEQLPFVIERLNSEEVMINSIHGHTSSADRSANNYVVISDYMLDVCEKYKLCDIEFFDVGGGFFGAAAEGIDVSNKPTYADYSKAIFNELLDNEWFNRTKPYVVIEPGASVVSNVFSYVSKVYQVKKINGKIFVTTDGSVFDVKPSMHKYNLPFKLFSKTEMKNNVVCDFVGSTCMEKDVILSEVIMPCPQLGDFVKIDGVGAYTMVLTPDFINYKSPIVDVSGDAIALARRRQNLSDVINTYTF